MGGQHGVGSTWIMDLVHGAPQERLPLPIAQLSMHMKWQFCSTPAKVGQLVGQGKRMVLGLPSLSEDGKVSTEERSKPWFR